MYITQISIVNQFFRLAQQKGEEMSSGKSEGRVCMPVRYLYISQSKKKKNYYWFRSVKQKLESETSEEKKA
jgi:hypothetical protein